LASLQHELISEFIKISFRKKMNVILNNINKLSDICTEY